MVNGERGLDMAIVRHSAAEERKRRQEAAPSRLLNMAENLAQESPPYSKTATHNHAQ